MKKMMLTTLTVFALSFPLSACTSQENYDDLKAELDILKSENESLRESISKESASVQEANEDIEDEPTDIEGLVSFGSTFMFRDFEIEIGSVDDVIWRTVENSYNDYYGNDVVGIPVTVTNFSGESGRLNSFSYSFFGPNGTQLSNVIGHKEYHIWDQGDMRHEASQQGYFMLMYDGDGDYVIEFSGARSEYVEVVLPIKK